MARPSPLKGIEMSTDNIVAEAAANAIAEKANDQSLDKVIINNDEFSMSAMKSHLMDSNVDADEHTVVWSMQDGSQSIVLKHKLNEVLRKRNADGSSKFWVTGMPGNPPKQVIGQLLCYLHPDHPEREWMDSIGLQGQVCKKSNMPSLFDVESHMLNRHQQEAKLVEGARERERIADERELAKLQIEAIRGAQEVPKPKRKTGG